MSTFVDLTQIVLIDLSLAADNALVVGMAVTALPAAQRKIAMISGIGAATILRIVMAFFAVQLLHITGLMAAGGLLLIWVCWKMLREVHAQNQSKHTGRPSAKKMSHAIWQIVIADISMSLDNVLGVAGVARDDTQTLVIGLGLSVVLMGLASTQIAKLAARYPKVGYIGAAIIFYTGGRMLWDGMVDLWPSILAYV